MLKQEKDWLCLEPVLPLTVLEGVGAVLTVRPGDPVVTGQRAQAQVDAEIERKVGARVGALVAPQFQLQLLVVLVQAVQRAAALDC